MAGVSLVGDEAGGVSRVREEGGAAGASPESREEGASSITVTSTLFLGEGDRDLGQGGSGEPPVEEPSGEGRSMEGEGVREGDRDRGDVTLGAGSEEVEGVDWGVSGLEAPGEIEVGLGERTGLEADWGKLTSVLSGCCTGEEGEEAASVEDEDDSADERVEVEDEEIQMGSSSCSTGDAD